MSIEYLRAYRATRVPRIVADETQPSLIENALAQIGFWNDVQLHLLYEQKLAVEYRIVTAPQSGSASGDERTRLYLLIAKATGGDGRRGEELNGELGGFERLMPMEYGWERADPKDVVIDRDEWRIARIVRRVDFATLPSPSAALDSQRSMLGEILLGSVNEEQPAQTGICGRRLPDCEVSGRREVLESLESYEICMPFVGDLGAHTHRYRRLFQELEGLPSVVISLGLHPVDATALEQDRGVAQGWSHFWRPFTAMLANAGLADRSMLQRAYDRYFLPAGHLAQLSIRVAARERSVAVSVANHVCARLGGAKCYRVIAPKRGAGSDIDLVFNPEVDVPVMKNDPRWPARRSRWHDRLIAEGIALARPSGRAWPNSTLAELDFLVRLPHLYTVEEIQQIMALPVSDDRGLPGVRTELVPPFGTVSNQYDPVVVEDLTGDRQLQRPPADRLRLGMVQRLPVMGNSGDWMAPGVQHWHSMALNDLTKHALIVGSTGSGKTRTATFLIRELARKRGDAQKTIPFLIIEPVKTEYYVALKEHIAGLQRAHFEGYRGAKTKGFLPFDPMRILNGVTVSRHASYLKSCFEAAFPLDPSMGLVLESGIRAYFTSGEQEGGCGYPLFSSGGARCRKVGGHLYNNVSFPRVRPSLTDFADFFCLQAKSFVHKVCPAEGSGYGADWANQVISAFKRRFENLLSGVLGESSRLADTVFMEYGIPEPLSLLLQRPTVLELDGIPDTEQKALAIAFLMTFLYEARQAEALTALSRNEPMSDDLKHVVVIEEAHRLLQNRSSLQGERSGEDARAKAVSLFVDMLAEIRGYGQGVVIVEQIPTKITPDAVKNTNLKIMLRLTSQDDRDYLGSAMNMSPDQSRFVTGLRARRGETVQYVVFEEGIDQPVLLTLPIPATRDLTFDNQFF